MDSQVFRFRICDVTIAVTCPAKDLRALIQAQWGSLEHSAADPELRYSVMQDHANSAISILCPSGQTKSAGDDGEFLFELEADITISLQQIRKELYFLHAGVAEVSGNAVLLVAESGGGKSTTLWGMLHHGWSYLSDELAPIDLDSMHVHAYQRALGLKSDPPPGYPLPRAVVQTRRSLHLPLDNLPQVSDSQSCPVAAAYFVKYCPDAMQPTIRPISAGESGARLYANALNQLAHPNAGLDGAIRIAKRITSYALDSADLRATCELLRSHSV